MVSIKDVAKLAKVSVATVSRVINGNVKVSEEKKSRILEVIEETGYVPNRAAQDMVLKKTKKIGIFLPNTFNQFQRQLFSEIAYNLEELGYYSSFFFVNTDSEGEKACLNKLKSERVDGVIVLQEIELIEFRDYLKKNEIPTVLVTFESGDWENASSIHIQDEVAAKVVVNYLIELGHKDIAMLGSRKHSFGVERERGYKKALKEANLQFNKELSINIEAYNVVAGSNAIKELLKKKIPFSAIFAHTDELAFGAIRELLDNGIRVPEDVSVVGIDDIEYSSYTSPSLTTIRQPLEEMGKLTVTILHNHISGKSLSYEKNLLPISLIKRESAVKLN